nr:CbiX/SirB N-terminal domain-containing protein [Phytohalomonas tamaricis]
MAKIAKRTNNMNKALILLAHGSPDSRWQAPFEALESQLKPRVSTRLRLAYMELCEPSLETVVEELSKEGFDTLDILPLFFAAGRHLREDVPAQLEALNQHYPKVSLSLLEPVGQHQAFTNAIVNIVEETSH